MVFFVFNQSKRAVTGRQGRRHRAGRSGPSLFALLIACLLGLALLAPQPVQARKKYDTTSPLTVDQQKALYKAQRYAKRGRGSKAAPIFENILATCTDLQKCLALASYTNGYGHPLSDIKRRAMQKAYDLCRTHEDFIQLALRARQYECYDVTRRAIQRLVSTARTKEQLTDLARKSQEVSMNDVAHLAMEKQYSMIKTVPEALEYARQVSLLGMDDLLRQVVKDLIDDENNPKMLLALLRSIEVFKMKDMNRYLMKKVLESPTDVDALYELWRAAQRHRMNDIAEVAVYRAKKAKLTRRIKKDRKSYQQKLEEWRQNKAIDSQNQKLNGVYGGAPSVGGF